MRNVSLNRNITSNMIGISSKPSVISAILITILSVSLCYLIRIIPHYKHYILIIMVIVVIYWLIQLVNKSKTKIVINTERNKIYLIINRSVHQVTLIKYLSISFCLTILILRNQWRIFIIPIFVDSVTPIKHYKQFKAYLRWH